MKIKWNNIIAFQLENEILPFSLPLSTFRTFPPVPAWVQESISPMKNSLCCLLFPLCSATFFPDHSRQPPCTAEAPVMDITLEVTLHGMLKPPRCVLWISGCVWLQTHTIFLSCRTEAWRTWPVLRSETRENIEPGVWPVQEGLEGQSAGRDERIPDDANWEKNLSKSPGFWD